jgi:hypothetical protein
VAAETIRFKIEDQEYDVPEVDDLDMDEWQVIYDYSGLILDDFAPIEDDDDAEQARTRRLAQPAFTTAMLHIGYQRAHPKMKAVDIKALVSGAKMLHILEQFGESTSEDDAVPPASTTEPTKSSPASSVASNANTSLRSVTSSEEQAAPPAPTGTGG